MDNLIFNQAQLLAPLSLSLDLICEESREHHCRVTVVAYRLARELGLNDEYITNTVSASLLHDIGVISREEKLSILRFDYKEERGHAERGSMIVKESPILEHLAPFLRHHHDSWTGSNTSGVAREEIPLISRIIYLADRLVVLISNERYILEQRAGIMKKILEYEGAYFEGGLVRALEKIAQAEEFWLDLTSELLSDIINKIVTGINKRMIGFNEFLTIARIFGTTIDARSHWTLKHCQEEAKLAMKLGRGLGLSDLDIKKVGVAAYLHDLGKIAVPAAILDKPGPLTPVEYDIVKKHPYYTYHILNSIDGFQEIAEWAAFHHEKLNGQGYPFRRDRSNLSLGAKIVAVTDKFTALAEDRPYRPKLFVPEAIHILEQDVKNGAIDNKVFETLKAVVS